MPRVKRGVKGARRRKSVMKAAKGYRGAKSKLMRSAMEAVDKGNKYAYTHRKLKKRDFRKLWTVRISAAAKDLGVSYSRLISGLKKNGINLNRKILAEIALSNPTDFAAIVNESKKAA